MEDDEGETDVVKVEIQESDKTQAATAAQLKKLMPSASVLTQMTATLDRLGSVVNSIGKPMEFPSFDIPNVKSPDDYIIEAQRETRNAVQELLGVLETSVEVQRQQQGVLQNLLDTSDHQTHLSRWVLGVTTFAAAATSLGIAATILVALFVI